MEARPPDLINAMEAERIRRGLDHKAFSALLGITDSYWCMIRKGKRRISLDLLNAIYRKLPEVSIQADTYARSARGELVKCHNYATNIKAPVAR